MPIPADPGLPDEPPARWVAATENALDALLATKPEATSHERAKAVVNAVMPILQSECGRWRRIGYEEGKKDLSSYLLAFADNMGMRHTSPT